MTSVCRSHSTHRTTAWRKSGHFYSRHKSRNIITSLSAVAGLPVNLIRRLQSVQNAAARLTFGFWNPSLGTLSRTRSPVFTGFVSLSASFSRSLCWPTVQWTAVHRSTCTCHLTSSGSPTWHPDCGFDHLIPINLWCHPTISYRRQAGLPSLRRQSLE